jgi:hypothetical protein
MLLTGATAARDTPSVKSNHRKHQAAFGNGSRFFFLFNRASV